MEDCLSVVFSFMDWRDAIRCATVCKHGMHYDSSGKRTQYFFERKHFYGPEDTHVNEALAIEWLNEKVRFNKWFGREPEMVRGCLVDTADFQNSFCYATIIGWKKRNIVFPSLAPYTVTHAVNAIRANVNPHVLVRRKTEVQFLVRFLGWSNRWNEWKSRASLYPLGTKTMRYDPESRKWVSNQTQQWLIRKNKRSGFWQLCLYSRFSEPPHDALPLTDVTASLLFSENFHIIDYKIKYFFRPSCKEKKRWRVSSTSSTKDGLKKNHLTSRRTIGGL